MKDDIFDKLFELSVLNLFQPFYRKYKYILLYLFFGGVATILNIILFNAFTVFFRIHELMSNIIAWFLCVTVQFYTNRKWAFKVVVNTRRDFLNQMFLFYGACAFTLLLEEIIIYIFIVKLDNNRLLVKTIAQTFVIVMNYVLRKMVVFKKKDRCTE